jgi:hypothetical protein
VLTLFRERAPRLANLGYFGHMWELYAMWTWLPAYIAASYAARPDGSTDALPVGVTAFLAIGVPESSAVCSAGGSATTPVARVWPRWQWRSAAPAVCWLGSSSGVIRSWCSPCWSYGAASVIADSGLFSTCTSEVVDRRYVGTALTAQTAIGFLLTITIQATPLLVELGGWRLAVAVLGIGPAAGALAMARLARHMTGPGNLPADTSAEGVDAHEQLAQRRPAAG